MIGRWPLAIALALVTGVVAVLGLAAADRAYGRPGAAILIALAAVYLLCAFTLALVFGRRTRR